MLALLQGEKTRSTSELSHLSTGGGAIPTMYAPCVERNLIGFEAVIDKDFCSELLAREVDPD